MKLRIMKTEIVPNTFSYRVTQTILSFEKLPDLSMEYINASNFHTYLTVICVCINNQGSPTV